MRTNKSGHSRDMKAAIAFIVGHRNRSLGTRLNLVSTAPFNVAMNCFRVVGDLVAVIVSRRSTV
jgi:hypothetical protein